MSDPENKDTFGRDVLRIMAVFGGMALVATMASGGRGLNPHGCIAFLVIAIGLAAFAHRNDRR